MRTACHNAGAPETKNEKTLTEFSQKYSVLPMKTDVNLIEVMWVDFFKASLSGVLSATEPDDDGEIDEDDCAEAAAAVADSALPLWLERFHPELKKQTKGRRKAQDEDEDEDPDSVTEPAEAPVPPPRARRRR